MKQSVLIILLWASNLVFPKEGAPNRESVFELNASLIQNSITDTKLHISHPYDIYGNGLLTTAALSFKNVKIVNSMFGALNNEDAIRGNGPSIKKCTLS